MRPRNVLCRLTVANAANTIRSIAQLAEAGLAAAGDLPLLEEVAARYAIAITPDIAALIDPSAANDPIARQFVPDAARAPDCA